MAGHVSAGRGSTGGRRRRGEPRLYRTQLPMTWQERERAFYIGAPLAIVPALGFLPAVMFLVVVPKIAHALASYTGLFLALIAAKV